MESKVVVILFCLSFAYCGGVMGKKLNIVARAQWGAEPPTNPASSLIKPVPNVVIHHSDTPSCKDLEQCTARVRSIQHYHQTERKWDDVGYNFLVGTDGRVYEGRGWNTIGAHVKGFNDVSIGICLIGTFNDVLPPQRQLNALHVLLLHAVNRGHVRTDYALLGHRQVAVNGTDCPGNSLFNEIKTWSHFSVGPWTKP